MTTSFTPEKLAEITRAEALQIAESRMFGLALRLQDLTTTRKHLGNYSPRKMRAALDAWKKELHAELLVAVGEWVNARVDALAGR